MNNKEIMVNTEQKKDKKNLVICLEVQYADFNDVYPNKFFL